MCRSGEVSQLEASKELGSGAPGEAGRTSRLWPKASALALHQKNGCFVYGPVRDNGVDAGGRPQEVERGTLRQEDDPMPEGGKPISSEPAPSHRPWASARARPLADLDASKPELIRQTVSAIGLHDPGLLAGRGDGHLCGAFGALSSGHDLLAKLVIAGPFSQLGQGLANIGRFYFSPVGSEGWFGSVATG